MDECSVSMNTMKPDNHSRMMTRLMPSPIKRLATLILILSFLFSLIPCSYAYHYSLTKSFDMTRTSLKNDNFKAVSIWPGLIGVDYQPNHYPVNNAFNFHDVFYVGNNPGGPTGTAVTNTYSELAQLKNAGFTAVRSYQTTDYSWVDIIHSANQLGMKVIYEAVIPYNGNSSDISAATSLLSNVINYVGLSTFNKTVILVLAGHENYCDTCGPGGGSNITYLTNAVTSLQSVTTVPVGSAVVSGNLVTPSAGISADMTTLINAYSSSAPLAFDPYPFQWGVQVADAVKTISSSSAINSIGWDYYKVLQNFPAFASRPILMAESGWASAGTTNPGYACNTPGPCTPSILNEYTYLSALYAFVRNQTNNAGLLVFEAYDEPAKVPGGTDMEDYYGVFDQNCNPKGSIPFLPEHTIHSGTETGCQGYSNGALLTVVGGFGHPYTVVIRQNNPVTGADASITVNNPTGNAGPIPDAPFPSYLVFPSATITIRGNAPSSCTSTIKTISNQNITFSGSCNCPNNNQNQCFY